MARNSTQNWFQLVDESLLNSRIKINPLIGQFLHSLAGLYTRTSCRKRTMNLKVKLFEEKKIKEDIH